MSLKHINLLFKLILHINTKQKKKKFNFKFQKEFLPILIFLKKKNLILNFKSVKNKYISIHFKVFNNINFFKKVKVFNFKKHDFKKYIQLTFLKRKNLFKYCLVFTIKGLYSFEDSFLKKKGGLLITTFN